LVVGANPGTRSTAAASDSSEYPLEIEGLLPFHYIVGRFTPLGSQGLRGQCPVAFGDLFFVETLSPPDGSDPEFENTRIIIVNGVVKQEEIDQLLKSGAEDFVPKPSTITKEAGATKAGLHAIKRKHLGNDHALLGKQLAQRWRLPGPIKPAIWLHRSDAGAFAHTISTVTKPGSCLCYRTDKSSGSYETRPYSVTTNAPVDDAMEALAECVKAQVHISPEVKDVLVDSAQVVAA
jgi:hypothetical protein